MLLEDRSNRIRIGDVQQGRVDSICDQLLSRRGALTHDHDTRENVNDAPIIQRTAEIFNKIELFFILIS